MKNLLAFLSLISILNFYGCAPQGGKSNLKISVAAITGSAQFPGGLLIMAKNDQTNQKLIRRVLASDSIELELDNGLWSFAAIGWEGEEMFTGDVQCEQLSGIELKGGDFPLELRTQGSKCSAALFGGVVDANNQFLPLRLQSCMDIKNHISDTSESFPSDLDCTPGNNYEILEGGVKSFKVSVAQVGFDGSLDALGGLASKCQPTSNGAVDTQIKLPFGSSDFDMKYFITGYDSADCTSAPRYIYKFPAGFSKNALNDDAIALENTSTSQINIALNALACVGDHLAIGKTFAAGSGSGPYLICTKKQFENIGLDSSTRSNSYLLGRDIFFGGSNTTISSGPFTGSLDGRDHALVNGNQPIFDIIQTSSGNEKNRISDLTIDGFVLDLDIGAPRGILANTISPAGTTNKEMEISNITINSNSSIKNANTANTPNTYLGGLFGFISFTGSVWNESLYIREIKSFASVDGSQNTNIIAGGLAGAIYSGNVLGQVSLERIFIGVADEKDPKNVSKRVNITGDTKVGGLVGSSKYMDIRGGNMVIANMSGNAYIGGVVGNAGDQTKISDSFTDIIYSPFRANSSKVGGVIGGIGGDYQVDINGTIAHLVTENVSHQINELGGLIGRANYSASTLKKLRINNSRVYLNAAANGKLYGGFIGEYVASSYQNEPIIRNSVAMGFIDHLSISSINYDRGGFVGNIVKGKIERSIAKFEIIKGKHKIGGAFGSATDGLISEAYLTANINCTDSTGIALNCGGVVGINIVGGLGTPLFKNIKIHSAIKTTLNGSQFCDGNSTCGLFSGYENVSNAYDSSVVATATSHVNKADSYIQYEPCGGVNGASYCAGTFYYNDSEPTCTALVPGKPFFYDGTACRPSFEYQWDKYGAAVDGTLGAYYKAGNAIEPFPITSTIEWNEIGSDALLISKWFELKKTLDFGNTDGFFTSIGGDYNAAVPSESFTGGIISNGFKLINITHSTKDIKSDANKTSGGLFPLLGESGSIGTRDEPLEIENLNLICNENKCGVVGEAQGGGIFTEVTDSTITGTATSSVGGLLGNASGNRIEISSSGFEGSIDMPNATGVGGLVGGYTNSTGGVQIDESYAKLSYIHGSSNVGGIIGDAPTPSSDGLGIDTVYVWIDINNVHPSGDDMESNSSMAGGIVGYLGGGSITIDNVYIDYSKAQTPTMFKSIMDGAGSITNGSPVMIAIGPSASNAVGSEISEISQADAFKNHFDGEKDWALKDGRIYLDWEINGFEK